MSKREFDLYLSAYVTRDNLYQSGWGLLIERGEIHKLPARLRYNLLRACLKFRYCALGYDEPFMDDSGPYPEDAARMTGMRIKEGEVVAARLILDKAGTAYDEHIESWLSAHEQKRDRRRY